MAETPQPAPVEAPPPPQPEAPAAPAAGAEQASPNQSTATNLESQVQAAESQGAPSDEAQAEVFKDLANRGDGLEPGALEDELAAMQDGKAPEAPADSVDGQTADGSVVASTPPVENTQGSTPAEAQAPASADLANRGDALQPGALEQELADVQNGKAPEAPAEPTAQEQSTPEVQAAEQRHQELINMNTDQLKDLASKGDKDAEQVLKNLTPEQAAATPPAPEAQLEPPLKPDGTRMSNDEWMTMNADQRYKAINGVDSPGSQAANEQADGAKVETTNDTAPPPEVPAAEAVPGNESNAENNADAEMNPEQKAAAERKTGMELAEKMRDAGITPENPHYQEVADLIAENPEIADKLQALGKAFGAITETSDAESAAAATEGAAASIDQQMDAARAKGDEGEVKRLGILRTLLRALGAALRTITVAAAGAAVGAVAGAGAAVSATAKRVN